MYGLASTKQGLIRLAQEHNSCSSVGEARINLDFYLALNHLATALPKICFIL